MFILEHPCSTMKADLFRQVCFSYASMKTFVLSFAPQLHAMGARTILLPVNPPPVSSTEIRARVRAGLPIDGLVPPAVAEYIASHGLYRAPKGETAQ